MIELQHSATSFALDELSAAGALLVANDHVYLRTGDPASWCEVATVASLEDLDRAAMPPEDCPSPDSQRVGFAEAKAAFSSLLPSAARPYASCVLSFCVQVERHRRGEAVIPSAAKLMGVDLGQATPLIAALGSPVALIYHGIVFVPRVPLRDAVAGLPTADEALLPFFEPGGAVTMGRARARYDPWLTAARRRQREHDSLTDDIMAVMKTVGETVQTPRSGWVGRVVCDCPETGFAVAIGGDGRPALTLASDPWVVEDADGTLYRFDGFVLAVRPAPGGQSTLLEGTPTVVYPPRFQHWLPTQPLHMCSYRPEVRLDNVLRLDNAVSLLLSGRHMLRAGLYGQGARKPLLALRFRQRRISREEADRLGLPIYPFRRQAQGLPRVVRSTVRGTALTVGMAQRQVR